MVDALNNFKYVLKNEWPRYLLILIWLIINLISFVVVYFSYHDSLAYFYLRKIVQDGVSVSRASAFCINLNCAVLLPLVCRNLLSKLRRLIKHAPTNMVRVIDKHISYHRHVAYLIVFFSILHTLGHIANMEHFVEAHNSKYIPSYGNKSDADLLSGLLSTLSLLDRRQNASWINPVHTDDAVPILECLKVIAGVTGVVMCLALSIIVSTSGLYMRRSFYNLFWFAHQIFAILFFIPFVLHGLEGIVRKQTNLDRHDPQKCYLIYSEWPSIERQCDIPQFAGSFPVSWIWILLSLLIYLSERLIRLVRGIKKHRIVKFIKHPSNVLELQIDIDLKYQAGQYGYLNAREISFFEWHPFTLTSCPNDTYLSVHMRCCGDWTNRLSARVCDETLKHISVDGPYGSCAEDIFKYEKVILIGAGIGATPYASILKQIWHSMQIVGDCSVVKKVHFFWICSTIDSFEWFGELLKNLEEKMKQKGKENSIEYKIYLTRGWSLKEAKKIAFNDGDEYDLFTGLEQKTNYGRPNFDSFFKEYAEEHSAQEGKYKCGVFFCGPSELSKQLHKLCNKYSNKSVRFYYNKESF